MVDSRDAVLAEAGDLLIPLAQGVIEESHIHAELGQIVSGQAHGRTDEGEITYFKSVGVAVQDAVAGRIAFQHARADNLGTIIEF